MPKKLAWLKEHPILLFLAIMGPGIVTAAADNDAGGIATYSIAGARYGYRLLWLLFLITISLAVVQEMAARMGAVTGKGLAALIREQFSLRMTTFCMVTLLVANLATTVAEFAGIAASVHIIFGVPKHVAVPIAAAVVWLLVVRGSYRSIEKVFLGFTLVYVTYVISGFLVHPPWLEIARATVVPSFKWDAGFLILAIAVVGTTITPWMQFFIQANVVDKGIDIKEYPYTRADVFLGAFFTDFIAFFIVVACAATLYVNNIQIKDAADAALALQPLAGRYAGLLFAIGLLNASVLAACILPLSTSYAVCEAFGWESGLDKRWSEAPLFNGIYAFSILFGAAFILLVPASSLLNVMLLSQEVNGILLPIILIYMLIIVNDRYVMGEHVNGPVFNVIAWGTALLVIAATAVLLVVSVVPSLGG